jgi:hypothetical protein
MLAELCKHPTLAQGLASRKILRIRTPILSNTPISSGDSPALGKTLPSGERVDATVIQIQPLVTTKNREISITSKVGLRNSSEAQVTKHHEM